MKVSIFFLSIIILGCVSIDSETEFGDILDQVYILLSGNDNLNLPSHFNVSNENWMQEMLKEGKDIKLKDLSLVGAHDSATYDLIHAPPLAPNCPSEVEELYYKLLNDTKIGKYLKEEGERVLLNLIGLYATSTQRPIYDQLRGGVRFLDFRICWLGDVPRSCHGFYGGSYTEYLGEIAEFMRTSEGELVYVEFSHFYNDGEGDLKQKKALLVKEIESHLGEYAVKRDTSKSLDEEVENLLGSYLGKDVVNDGPKVIIWFDDHLSVEENDFLWPCFVVGEYANSIDTNYIEKTQKDQLLEWMSKEGGVGKLNDGKHIFSISWTMTLPESDAGLKVVVENGLKDERWLSLHGFSNVINELLMPFMSSSLTLSQQSQINVVWIDYFYECQVIELVKYWNMFKLQ